MKWREDTSTLLLPCCSYLQINVAEKKKFMIPKQNQHILKNSFKMYYARDSAMRMFQATIKSTSNAIGNSTTSWKSRAFIIFVLIWDLGMCMGNANKKFKRHDKNKKSSTNRRETSQPKLPSLQKKQKHMQCEKKNFHKWSQCQPKTNQNKVFVKPTPFDQPNSNQKLQDLVKQKHAQTKTYQIKIWTQI